MTVQYVLHDRSILLPHVTRWVVKPLLRVIPHGVSANALTLSSLTCAATGFAASLLLPPSGWTLLLVALLFTGYTLLDNLDGPHARQTGTTSPLGEFLDHWLDCLNGIFVFVGSVFALQAQDARGMAIIALMVASTSLTFWEQRVTGRMYMGRIGTLEGLLLVMGMLLLAAIVGTAHFHEPLWRGYDGIDFTLWAGIIAGGSTILGPMWRTGRKLHQALGVVAVLAALLAWQQLGQVPLLLHCVLAAAVGPLTGGRFILGRVTKQENVGPEVRVLTAIGVAALACLVLRPSAAVQTGLAAALLVWAVVQMLLDFRGAVRQLAAYVRPNELLAHLLAK